MELLRAHRPHAHDRASVNAHYGRTFECAFAPDVACLLSNVYRDSEEEEWNDDDADVVATGGEDGVARVFAVRHGSHVREISCARGHSGEVLRIAFASSGAFATASADGSCKIWTLEADESAGKTNASGRAHARCAQTLDGHPGEVYGCVFMDDVRPGTIATCSETEVYWHDVETKARTGASKRETRTTEAETSVPDRWSPGYLFSLTRSEELGVLACGCSDGAIRVYSDGARGGTFGEIVATASPHPNAIVGTTVFIDQGRVLASVGLDGTIALTDTRTWGMFRRISTGTRLMSACGVGGGWLATVGATGAVRAMDVVHDAQAPAHVFAPPIEPLVPLFCVAANAKGTRLACAGAGVPLTSPTLGATFSVKRPDLSRLDVWTAKRPER